MKPSNLFVNGALKTKATGNKSIDYNIGYGLGLIVGIYDGKLKTKICFGINKFLIEIITGWLRIGHGGYIAPYESMMNIYPELNLGIFSSTNGPGSTGYSQLSVDILHNALFDIIEGIFHTYKCSVIFLFH